MNNKNKGILYALSAYIFWGVHPIYWKLLFGVPASEIVAHRIIWSFAFFTILISYRRGWKGIIGKIAAAENKTILFVPPLLIGSNWFVYVWAVNAGFIVETSLGYFISPLISVFLGVFLLNEKLRTFQWIAVFIAGAGVLVSVFIYGQFPWISLFLATTWGFYGLLRKKSPLNSVEGLTLEMTILFVPVIIYLFSLQHSGAGSFFTGVRVSLLLIGAGMISALPLLIFIAGTRIINLSLIGVMQYIYPTLLFVIGAYVYHEPLNAAKITGFIFIWTALLLYSGGSVAVAARKRIIPAAGAD
jgi:chloramphenicol-sensitive protein RarD